jgi:hypothetical protein
MELLSEVLSVVVAADTNIPESDAVSLGELRRTALSLFPNIVFLDDETDVLRNVGHYSASDTASCPIMHEFSTNVLL